MRFVYSVLDRLNVLRSLTRDFLCFIGFMLMPRAATAARILWLEKQVGAFVERKHKPHRLDDAARIVIAAIVRLFGLKDLFIVKPDTLVRWERDLWRLFWRWKSRPGRPKLSRETRQLIREMVLANPAWGQNRVALELLLKLGIFVSPRTVRRYWPRVPRPPGGRQVSTQRWATFVRNHIHQIVACDFLTVGLWRLHFMYVFVMIELGSRRILHVNVTRHPTPAWSAQQVREALPPDHSYRFLIHDRDGIFSEDFDRVAKNIGVRALKTPPRTPKANAFCERVIGTIRRECFDWLIPISEAGLRSLLREWVPHYNRSRPHMALGPGIPDPAPGLPAERQTHRHRIPNGFHVENTSILGGLHHDYRLVKDAA